MFRKGAVFFRSSQRWVSNVLTALAALPFLIFSACEPSLTPSLSPETLKMKWCEQEAGRKTITELLKKSFTGFILENFSWSHF